MNHKIFTGANRVNRGISFLLPLSFLCALLLNAGAQTTVYFPVLTMTGATNDVTFNIKAANNPIAWNGRYYFLPVNGTNCTSTNSYATNTLVPGKYVASIVGQPQSWNLYVTNTTDVLNAVDLSTEIRFSGVHKVVATNGATATITGDTLTIGGIGGGTANGLTNGQTDVLLGSGFITTNATIVAAGNVVALYAVGRVRSDGGYFGEASGLTNYYAANLITNGLADATAGKVLTVKDDGSITVSNVIGSTTISEATYAASGVVSTNNFTLLSLPGHRAYRPPLNFFNTWASPSYGGGPWVASTDLAGYTNILVAMTNMVNGGYAQLGYGFQVDEVRGALGYDSLGNVYWPSNQFPQGMKAVADICHALGMPFGLCVPLGTNAAVPLTGGGLRPENIEQSATNIANWGVDFVYLISDNGGFGEGQATFEMYKRFIAAYRGHGKGVRVMAGLDGNGGNQLRPWMLEQMGDGLLYPWPGYADSPSTPSAIFNAVDSFASVFGSVIGQNVYPYMSFMGGANGDTTAIDHNMWNTRTAINALYHGVMGISSYYAGSDGSYAGKVNHTNEWMLSVQQDIGCWPPTQVATNNGIQVLACRLGDWNANRRAVVFANRITNATQTTSITWSNLSLPNGTYTVRDVWNMSQFTSTTNALGVSLVKYQCGFYIIEPAVLATIPSMYLTNTQTGVVLRGELNQNPIGSGNVNYGTNGFVGGLTSTVGPLATNAFAYGTSMNVTGNRAIGLGGGLSGGTVSGADAVGMGNAPTASGSQSFAFGNGTASGTGDYVFGPQSLASGNYGFALGYKARKTAQGAFMINCGVSADVFRTNSTADSFMVWATGGHRFYGSALTITNGLTINSNYVALNFTPPPAGEIKWAVSNGFFWTITTLKTNYTGISAN